MVLALVLGCVLSSSMHATRRTVPQVNTSLGFAREDVYVEGINATERASMAGAADASGPLSRWWALECPPHAEMADGARLPGLPPLRAHGASRLPLHLRQSCSTSWPKIDPSILSRSGCTRDGLALCGRGWRVSPPGSAPPDDDKSASTSEAVAGKEASPSSTKLKTGASSCGVA